MTGATNPFRFGALARDEEFTDREPELAELRADARNGQDVVIFAPRRYGKSSLVDRLQQLLISDRILVGQVNLMACPTRARLAEKLAELVWESYAGPLARARDATVRIFRGLRVTPVIGLDPESGRMTFSFSLGAASPDLDATIERLLELVAELAAERERRAVLIFDEFQEVADLDPGLPKLLRSVFQEQPEVCHLYLGSKRHMMERIFNDEDEPFWRSAKHLELGPIPAGAFTAYIEQRFRDTGRRADDGVAARVLELTGGHPYATQELCYFLWEETPARGVARIGALDRALAAVLRSENAHFSLLWDGLAAGQRVLLVALATEPGRPLTEAYRGRHPGLPSVSTTQKALEALARMEIVSRDGGHAEIAEPFLDAWVRATIL